MSRLSCLASLLLAAFANAAEQSPVNAPPSLAGLYYTKEFTSWLAKERAAGTFDPQALSERIPLSLAFDANGELIVQDVGFQGMESVCRVRSEGKGAELRLEVTCQGDLSPRHYHWRWLSPDEAETDLFRGAEVKHPVVVRARDSFPELVHKYHAALQAKLLPAIAGRYVSSDGARAVVIDAQGNAMVGDGKVALSVSTCHDFNPTAKDTEKVKPKQASIILLDPEGERGKAGEWFARVEGGRASLVEAIQGFEAAGACGGCCFAKPGGETLHRVESPARAQTK
jgi:hypothetical protein